MNAIESIDVVYCHSVWFKHQPSTVIHIAVHCSMSVTAADICREIHDVGSMIAARKQSGCCAEKVAAAMTATIAHKITSIRDLSAASALKIQTTLNECSAQLGDTSTVQAAIDAGLATTATTPMHSHACGMVKFTFLHPEWYLVKEQWEVLWDVSAPAQAKAEVFKALLHGLGIHVINEALIKRIIGVLLVVSFSPSTGFPSYKAIYDMVQDFKEAVTTPPTTPVVFSILGNYPDDPKDLPRMLYDSLYSGDRQPVKVTLDRLNQTLRHVPMRKNSALLNGAQAAHKPVDTMSCQSLVSQLSIVLGGLRGNMPIAGGMQHINGMQHIDDAPHGASGFKMLRQGDTQPVNEDPHQKVNTASAMQFQPRSRLALVDGHVDQHMGPLPPRETTAVAESHVPGKGELYATPLKRVDTTDRPTAETVTKRATSEEIDAAAFNALKERNAKKADAARIAKKRPAAAAGSIVAKVPKIAAAVLTTKQIADCKSVIKWDNSFKTRGMNCWTSKCYCAAKQLGKRQSFSDAVCSEMARHAYSLATKKFESVVGV
jgi:hypothetical protein